MGFVNRDGSINLRLDGYPTNGTLQVRDYEPYSKDRDPSAPLQPRLIEDPRASETSFAAE